MSVAAATLLLVLAQTGTAVVQPPSETPDAAALLGSPAGLRFEGDALEAETERVGSLLRCPVCQGLSVTASPTTMATNMKRQVRELLGQGYDEEQILSYFEASYGEFVRLEPPMRGINWLVWLAPIGALLLGAGFVAWMVRGSPAGSEGAESSPGRDALPDRGALPDDEELASYVLRVRELAYGWPGGARPAPASKDGA